MKILHTADWHLDAPFTTLSPREAENARRSLRSAFAAALLACARQGLFFLPLIWFFPKSFGIQSIIYIQPVSDALTFLFAIPFILYALRAKDRKKQ